MGYSQLTDNHIAYLTKDLGHYVVQDLRTNNRDARPLGETKSFKENGTDFNVRIVKLSEKDGETHFRMILNGSDGYTKEQDIKYKEE